MIQLLEDGQGRTWYGLDPVTDLAARKALSTYAHMQPATREGRETRREIKKLLQELPHIEESENAD
jgi:hypothetical protein